MTARTATLQPSPEYRVLFIVAVATRDLHSLTLSAVYKLFLSQTLLVKPLFPRIRIDFCSSFVYCVYFTIVRLVESIGPLWRRRI